MRLSFEAQSVIGLRLFRTATGGVPAGPEAMHVTFADIQRILMLSATSGQPQGAAPKGVRHEAVMSSSPDQNEPSVTPDLILSTPCLILRRFRAMCRKTLRLPSRTNSRPTRMEARLSLLRTGTILLERINDNAEA